MGKNRNWLWAVLIACTQAGIFIVVLAAFSSVAASQGNVIPDWFRLLLFGSVFASVAGMGFLAWMLTRTNRDLEKSNSSFEVQLKLKTQEVSRTQTAIIYGLAKLSESRDTDTGDHLDRIQNYVAILAKDLSSQHPQLTEKAIENLSLASSLHDIGKVGIPDSILLKPGKLSQGERNVMQYHTVIGGECLEAIQTRLGNNQFLDMARDIAWSHHECWDGSGYPHQLSGTTIPLVARIVAVADVYDALTSKRPYKRAKSHSESSQILLQGKGTKFDPNVIDAFIRHESEFESISRKQQTIADEDCVSGLERLAQCVAALQSESTNLVGRNFPAEIGAESMV